MALNRANSRERSAGATIWQLSAQTAMTTQGASLGGTAMADVTIYHNPQCSHSRGALELLNGRRADFEVIEYLKTPPSRATLESIIAILDGPVADLVRKDKRFTEL